MALFESYERRIEKINAVLALIFAVLLCAVGVIRDNGLQIAGVLCMCGFLIWQNNRMMIYVEDRAFDGSDRQ